MIYSLNDVLQPYFVYNVLCVHIPRQERCKAGVFEKLIRTLLLMNISVFICIIDILFQGIAFILKQYRQQ